MTINKLRKVIIILSLCCSSFFAASDKIQNLRNKRDVIVFVSSLCNQLVAAKDGPKAERLKILESFGFATNYADSIDEMYDEMSYRVNYSKICFSNMKKQANKEVLKYRSEKDFVKTVSVPIKIPTVKIKVNSYKRPQYEFIPNIRQYINFNGDGDINKLSQEQQLRLADTLQYCGSWQKANLKSSVSLDDDFYIEDIKESNDLANSQMCIGAEFSLILQSYSILERIARTGNRRGLILFNKAIRPEILDAAMAGEIYDSDYKKIKSMHSTKANKLLIDSIFKGNIDSTYKVASYLRKGYRGFNRNTKSSLGYYLVLNMLFKNPTLSKIIEEMSYELTKNEIQEAIDFAINLANRWNNLSDGVWKSDG